MIVLSTKGIRRAADYLAGGDYDGDKVTVIWHPPIVNKFTPASNRFADPPSETFVQDNFETSQNVSVKEFFDSIEGLPTSEHVFRLQKPLLAGLQDISIVGIYSNLHENAVQMYGYKSPEAHRMAHMYVAVSWRSNL